VGEGESCEMGNEYDSLDDRLKYIEQNKISKIENDINTIKVNQTELGTMVKQFTSTMERVSDTMVTMNLAMHDMSNGMRDSNRNYMELAKNVDGINQKFDTFEDKVADKFETVNTRIDNQDDKTKLDTSKWGRWLVESGGLLLFVVWVLTTILHVV